MQYTYSTCLAFFLFSLHPSSPLSVSQPRTLLSAPTVKMRWLLGNHSACCSHHHWMLSWRSWDSEVKSDYSPDKWGVCVCVSGGAHARQQLWQKNCKRLHMMSGGSPLGLRDHWTLSFFQDFNPSSLSLSLISLSDLQLRVLYSHMIYPSSQE